MEKWKIGGKGDEGDDQGWMGFLDGEERRDLRLDVVAIGGGNDGGVSG